MQYLTPSEKEKLLRAVYSETGKHRKRNIAIFEVGLYSHISCLGNPQSIDSRSLVSMFEFVHS